MQRRCEGKEEKLEAKRAPWTGLYRREIIVFFFILFLGKPYPK